MLKFVLILLLLVAAAGSAESQERKDLRVVEAWKCYSPSDFSREKVLVEALRFEVLEERSPLEPPAAPGLIKVAGTAYPAVFVVDGFDRAWVFGLSQDAIAESPPFSFVVRPDGSGYYYDLRGVKKGESTNPRQTYECLDSGPQVPAGAMGADGAHGTLDTGTGKPCAQRPEAIAYLARVKSRVLSRWAGGQNGTVELQFSLDAAGIASEVEVVSASSPELGEAIAEAMRVASPFEPMSTSVQCLAGETLQATFHLTREQPDASARDLE